MPRQDLAFRVFVSSTFTDLVAERNALQQHVFPRLRDYCARHGARFQAIDLRWGVSDEAALDQQTMTICFKELERCQTVSPRPNFLVLLGNRYGWRPLPPQVAADELELLLGQLPEHARGRLRWDAGQPEGEKGWYRRDDNAVPPQYCLLPREGPYREGAVWAKEEQAVRAAFEAAIDRLGWPAGDPRRVKYEASATHQEILRGALTVPDAAEHVGCFLRRVRGLPQSAEAAGFIDLDEDGRPDADARDRLRRLQDELRRRLPEGVFEREAQWRGGAPTTAHVGTLPDDPDACEAMLVDGFEPTTLCEAVWRQLGRAIRLDLRGWREADPRAKEARAHDELGRSLARLFTGRGTVVEAVVGSCRGGAGRTTVLVGEAGSGKSSVLARAAEVVRERSPQAVVLERFVAATPASSSGPELLAGIIEDVGASYGDPRPAPADFAGAVRDLAGRLALATADQPLVVFLDGVDQLLAHDPARQVPWLPRVLPAHAHVVLSVTDPRAAEVIVPSSQAADFVTLDRMSVEEAARLLDRWLADARRRLQEDQRAAVLQTFAAGGLPFYLRLAFEEARSWRSFDGLPSYRGRPGLSTTVEGAIRDLLWRLARDEHHGPRLVERALAYLVVSRQGMSEEELLDVLAGDEEVRAELRRRFPRSPQTGEVPFAVWSRLFFELRPHLIERRADGLPLLRLAHRQFEGLVGEDLLPTREARAARHRALADLFERQPDTFGAGPQQAPNHRKLVELPYQLTEAGDLAAMTRQVEAGLLARKAEVRGELEALEDTGRIARVLAGAGPAWWDALVEAARLHARLAGDFQKTPGNLERFVRRGDLRSVASTVERENNLFRRGVICQALAHVLAHEGQERLAASYRDQGVRLAEENRFDTGHDPRLHTLEKALRGAAPPAVDAADLELHLPRPEPAPLEVQVPPRRWVPWYVSATSFPLGVVWLHGALVASLFGLMVLYFLVQQFPIIPFYPIHSAVWLACAYVGFPILRLVVWHYADPRPDRSRVLRGLRAHHDAAGADERGPALARLVEYYARLGKHSAGNRAIVLAAIESDLPRLTAAEIASLAVKLTVDTVLLRPFQDLVTPLPEERLREVQAAIFAAEEPEESRERWHLCLLSVALARRCPGGSRIFVSSRLDIHQEDNYTPKLEALLAGLPKMLLARSILLWCSPPESSSRPPSSVPLHPLEQVFWWATVTGLVLAGLPFYGSYAAAVAAFLLGCFVPFNYVHDLCGTAVLRRRSPEQIAPALRYLDGAVEWSVFFRLVQCPALRLTLAAERLFTAPERLEASITAPLVQATLRRLARRKLAVPRAQLVTSAMGDPAQLEAVLAGPCPAQARVPTEVEREAQWRRALPLPRAKSIPAVMAVTVAGVALALLSWRLCSGVTHVTLGGCWMVCILLILGLVGAVEQHWTLTGPGSAAETGTPTIDASILRSAVMFFAYLFLVVGLSQVARLDVPESTPTIRRAALAIYLLIAATLLPRHLAHAFIVAVRGSWLFYPGRRALLVSRALAVLGFVGVCSLLGYLAVLLVP
jgi:hypothetical protein